MMKNTTGQHDSHKESQENKREATQTSVLFFSFKILVIYYVTRHQLVKLQTY